MANLDDLRMSLSGLMNRVINPVNGTNFFQSRITRTPGVVSPITNASGLYDSTQVPSNMVMGSQLEAELRNKLAEMWKNESPGFITVQPNVPSKVMKHEQIHNVWDRGGLKDNYQQIDPMLALSWQNYVKHHDGYLGIKPPDVTNEALAYQLSSTPDEPYITNERRLENKVAKILELKGKSQEAKQIRRLAK